MSKSTYTIKVLGIIQLLTGCLILSFFFFSILFNLTHAENVYVYILAFTTIVVFIFLIHFCSGKILVELSDEKVYFKWLKIPAFNNKSDTLIHFSNITRWNRNFNPRGPDSFIIKTKDGTKFKMVPRVYARNNQDYDFYKDFEKRIEKLNQRVKGDRIITLEEEFYKSKKASIVKYAIIIIFIVDFLFIFLNPFGLRKLYALFMPFIFMWGFVYLLLFHKYNSKNS